MAYDNPHTAVYRFPAAAIITAGTIGRLIGPKGKKGRITDISYVITTSTTVAATAITIGITGATDKFASQTIPVAAVNATGNGGTVIALVDANDAVLITTNGGATAGAADILLMIDWFN